MHPEAQHLEEAALGRERSPRSAAARASSTRPTCAAASADDERARPRAPSRRAAPRPARPRARARAPARGCPARHSSCVRWTRIDMRSSSSPSSVAATRLASSSSRALVEPVGVHQAQAEDLARAVVVRRAHDLALQLDRALDQAGRDAAHVRLVVAERAEALDQDRRVAGALGQLDGGARVLERAGDVAAQHRHLGRELLRLGAQRRRRRASAITCSQMASDSAGLLLAQARQPQQRRGAQRIARLARDERVEMGARTRGVAVPHLVARGVALARARARRRAPAA